MTVPKPSLGILSACSLIICKQSIAARLANSQRCQNLLGMYYTAITESTHWPRTPSKTAYDVFPVFSRTINSFSYFRESLCVISFFWHAATGLVRFILDVPRCSLVHAFLFFVKSLETPRGVWCVRRMLSCETEFVRRSNPWMQRLHLHEVGRG